MDIGFASVRYLEGFLLSVTILEQEPFKTQVFCSLGGDCSSIPHYAGCPFHLGGRKVHLPQKDLTQYTNPYTLNYSPRPNNESLPNIKYSHCDSITGAAG